MPWRELTKAREPGRWSSTLYDTINKLLPKATELAAHALRLRQGDGWDFEAGEGYTVSFSPAHTTL